MRPTISDPHSRFGPWDVPRFRRELFFIATYMGVPTMGFPEVCALSRMSPIGIERLVGTGIVVHPGLILTIAHAVKEPQFAVFPASSLASPPSPANRHRLTKWAVVGNIGLLFLEREAVFTFGVPRLPTPSEYLAVKTVTGTIIGFGRRQDQGSVGEKLSGSQMRIADWPITEPIGQATNHFYASGTSGNCTMDSGGPYFVATGSGQVLMGVANRRPSNNTPFGCGPEGVYARIDVELPGIRATALANGIVLA